MFGLPTCIPMTTFGFGVVTASYTLGGFASSVLAGRLADAKGRKQTALYSAWLIVLVSVSPALREAGRERRKLRRF
jgi:MFS transporter, SP family, solute carrier family 2 (facilitated glucose transporter), member 3